MKTKPILIISAILLAFFTSQIQAEEPVSKWYNKAYVGGGLGYSQANIKTLRDTMAPSIIFGKNIVNWLDLELNYMHSLESDTDFYTNENVFEGYHKSVSNSIDLNLKFKKQMLTGFGFLLLGLGYEQSKLTTNDFWENGINERFVYVDKANSFNGIIGLGYEHIIENNVSVVLQTSYQAPISNKYNTENTLLLENSNLELQGKGNISMFMKLTF